VPDVTVKVSDCVREITVEINGSSDDPLAQAEETAVRLYSVAAATPHDRRAGFGGWTLNSDTECSGEEA
jgi:hypothetical protein